MGGKAEQNGENTVLLQETLKFVIYKMRTIITDQHPRYPQSRKYDILKNLLTTLASLVEVAIALTHFET